MSTDRQHGNIVFECDACGDVLETEQADWGSAWNKAKHEGWRSRKIDDVWVHHCDNCEVPF